MQKTLLLHGSGGCAGETFPKRAKRTLLSYWEMHAAFATLWVFGTRVSPLRVSYIIGGGRGGALKRYGAALMFRRLWRIRGRLSPTCISHRQLLGTLWLRELCIVDRESGQNRTNYSQGE